VNNIDTIHTTVMHTRTARLTLREFNLKDIPALYALESIPEVARYQTWPPRTRADAKRVVGEIMAEAVEVPRLIVEQAVLITAPQTQERTPHEVDGTGTFIGRVGGIVDSAARTAEVWFSFLPSEQRRGYATEALRALIELLREAARDGEVPPFDRLIIECDPRNDRSSKLAERMGFALESCTEKAFECKGEWVGSKVYTRRLDAAT
jgi:RimJ/RimL family protein N-acetyltransferase